MVLTARRGDRLEALATELRSAPRRCDAHDRRRSRAAAPRSRLAAELAARAHVDVLVNNAGYGVPGSYVNVPWGDHERFMQVMVTAVLD